jgi:hypothetical protein
MQFQLGGRGHARRAAARPAYDEASAAAAGSGVFATGVTRAVQNAHRVASRGMSLKHSGHARVSTSTAVSGWKRSSSALTGLMTKKKTTAATMTNEISALRNAP